MVKDVLGCSPIAVNNSQACSCFRFHLIPDQGTSDRTQPKTSRVAVQWHAATSSKHRIIAGPITLFQPQNRPRPLGSREFIECLHFTCRARINWPGLRVEWQPPPHSVRPREWSACTVLECWTNQNCTPVLCWTNDRPDSRKLAYPASTTSIYLKTGKRDTYTYIVARI